MMVNSFQRSASDFGDATVYRADSDALWVIKVALAVVAFGGVDDVHTFFYADGHVGAFRLTGVAGGAGFGVDFVGHGDTPLRLTK